MSETAENDLLPDGTQVRLNRGMPGTYEGQPAIVRHHSPSGHCNLPRLVWLECEIIWSFGTAGGFWASRAEYVFPPCEECGPGYRIGDDGCRHTPPERTDS